MTRSFTVTVLRLRLKAEIWTKFGSELKPWRIPGVDIRDFFSFGFNENTWKQYCVSLGQLWQTSVQIGIPVNESAKSNQEPVRERIDQVVSGSLLSPSSKCEVPKGRTIQVENSMFERQPSIHVRATQCKFRCYYTAMYMIHRKKQNFLPAITETIIILPVNMVLCLKSSWKMQNESKELSVQERNDLFPGVVKAQHLDGVDQHSEDAAEVLEGEIKTGRVGVDTCSADPCWIEPELSLGDQDLSLTSYTDNDSEETEDNVHVDNENNHLGSHLLNSDTDLKESLSLYHKTSKNIS